MWGCNMEEVWTTKIKINKTVGAKFMLDVGLDRERKELIIYTRKITGMDIFGDEEDYYKVITINDLGRVKEYVSENLTSNKWYSQYL